MPNVHSNGQKLFCELDFCIANECVILTQVIITNTQYSFLQILKVGMVSGTIGLNNKDCHKKIRHDVIILLTSELFRL